MTSRRRARGVAIGLLGSTAVNPASAEGRPVITIREHVRHQEIDGFGLSQAFRRNELVRALPEERQRELLDLWCGREKGAGGPDALQAACLMDENLEGKPAYDALPALGKVSGR